MAVVCRRLRSRPKTPPWKTQYASDVIRDGLGIELLDDVGNVVAEVFRCDADHTVTTRVYAGNIPATVIEELVELARTGLGPFEDGTPLPDDFAVERAD
jgi:hypothetical protein